MLFLVEFFKILRDDGDGERHHQHARDGTERPNQLPQSCKNVGSVHTWITYFYTDKKENQIFLIYRDIHSGAVAKSYMTNGLLIYGEIFSHFFIY
jgi:hypothetical protein